MSEGYTFKPMSDEEIRAMNLIPKGQYVFEVYASTRKVSKSGNPMCELNLKVWDGNGKVHIIYDYLVFYTANMTIKKIKNFCEAVGLEEDYKKGILREDLRGMSGYVDIDIREPQPKKGGGFWPQRNEVVAYAKKSEEDVPDLAAAADVKNEFDDDIPF